MSRFRYSEDLKLEVIKYLEAGHNPSEAAKKFCISVGDVQKWANAYEHHGEAGLFIKAYNPNKYTGEFKISVIEYKQKHALSARYTAAYFNIPSHLTVISWEKKYIQEGSEALKKEARGKSNCITGVMKGKQPIAKPAPETESLLEENKRLRMEVEYLKKLNALIQNQYDSRKSKK